MPVEVITETNAADQQLDTYNRSSAMVKRKTYTPAAGTAWAIVGCVIDDAADDTDVAAMFPLAIFPVTILPLGVTYPLATRSQSKMMRHWLMLKCQWLRYNCPFITKDTLSNASSMPRSI